MIWLSHPQWRAHGQREIVYRHKIATAQCSSQRSALVIDNSYNMPRVLHFGAFHYSSSLELPDPTLKYREGVRGQAHHDLCHWNFQMHNNCINVVGGMRIIIHVQQ